MKDELISFDAIALGELVRKKEVKPAELLEVTIQRIEKINPRLNAVIHKMYDQAREMAANWEAKVQKGSVEEAIFCGVPFLLKDLVAECKGAPFHEGSRAVKGYVSKIDTELVKRQKGAGLVIVGKTNTPEFGAAPTTEPILYGPTHNPWDLSLTPGGSSGGSAAAVAAGILPMAHGNDGGGSIRIPASCCGVFGLKPTRGRNTLGPLFGDIGSGIVHEHGLTRTVRDSAALLDVTSGPDLGDPYYAPSRERPFLEEVGRNPGRLKIGLLTQVPAGWYEKRQFHADCEAAVEDAAQLCNSLGHIVEEIDSNQLSHPTMPSLYGHIFSCYLGHAVSYWEKELGRKIGQEDLEPITWMRYQSGVGKSGGDYLVTIEEVQKFSRKIARWYQEGNYDLLLSPTMCIPPAKLGIFKSTPENPMQFLEVALPFLAITRVANLTGQPAMSIPLFWNKENIPIGVHFVGRFGDEATLFRLAAQLEQARPWKDRKPTIHCGNQ